MLPPDRSRRRAAERKSQAVAGIERRVFDRHRAGRRDVDPRLQTGRCGFRDRKRRRGARAERRWRRSSRECDTRWRSDGSACRRCRRARSPVLPDSTTSAVRSTVRSYGPGSLTVISAGTLSSTSAGIDVDRARPHAVDAGRDVRGAALEHPVLRVHPVDLEHDAVIDEELHLRGVATEPVARRVRVDVGIARGRDQAQATTARGTTRRSSAKPSPRIDPRPAPGFGR